MGIRAELKGNVAFGMVKGIMTKGFGMMLKRCFVLGSQVCRRRFWIGNFEIRAGGQARKFYVQEGARDAPKTSRQDVCLEAKLHI